MSKIEQFKINVLNEYEKIHGPHNIVGDETDMKFHGTQRPWEFFRAWEVIEKYLPDTDEVSFLEIGAAKGLWSIAFIEMCKLYNKKPVYVTVSMLTGSSLFSSDLSWNPTLLNVKKYYEGQYSEWVLFDRNSQTEESKDLVIGIRPKYDFVFIDADHTYNGVFNDTKLYSPLAKSLLIYHDIGPPYEGSVVRAIKDSGIELHHKIMAPNTGEGIGIHLKD
jgi:hypothetical protein